ncbi:PadR family transcriptional regulator [Cryobacterium frigoriphilum]|uniref:PadR family transcriptional regulator n=1 Tax=Cryobacterium frigoriphilum TaxID=1259150 RepID=A0A4R9A519_9MICO|nr:PadR family transcriptional regulator [Cryobacterium frigoriphilum]TFD52237.1 PadR family transcriptional regulator [Cryobacterium frigoriphilum]
MSQPTFWILIALAGQRRHGYEILQETAAASEGAVSLKATTLYAALERLERDGLIQPDGEEIVNGRARRYFRITGRGEAGLADEVAMLEQQARVGRARLGREPLTSLRTGFAV